VVQELKKKFLTMQKINFSFDLKTILLYGFFKKKLFTLFRAFGVIGGHLRVDLLSVFGADFLALLNLFFYGLYEFQVYHTILLLQSI